MDIKGLRRHAEGLVRGIDRSLNAAIIHLAAALIGLFLAATAATRSFAEAPKIHKSVKICNAELAERAAEIEKSGESPAAFFHACWTHATPGQATPIEATAKVETPPDAATPTRSARAARPRVERRIVTRRRYKPVDEVPRERLPAFAEPRQRFDVPAPPPPLPPVVANSADALGRVLRATGLPPIQVPVLIPGTLDVVPVMIVPH